MLQEKLLCLSGRKTGESLEESIGNELGRYSGAAYPDCRLLSGIDLEEAHKAPGQMRIWIRREGASGK